MVRVGWCANSWKRNDGECRVAGGAIGDVVTGERAESLLPRASRTTSRRGSKQRASLLELVGARVQAEMTNLVQSIGQNVANEST